MNGSASAPRHDPEDDEPMEDRLLMLCFAHARLQHLLQHVPGFPDAERHDTAMTVSEITDALEAGGVQPQGDGVFIFRGEPYCFPCNSGERRCRGDQCGD
ncbi:MAG TPA: hypothetical protein VIY27_12535 [Myxococcota bacterium]